MGQRFVACDRGCRERGGAVRGGRDPLRMGARFIGVDREQVFLMPPSVRDWVPEGHLVWTVLDAVGELDLSAFYAAYRSDGHGRPAYEPSMMVAVLMYAYARGKPVGARDRARVRGGCGVSRPCWRSGAGSLDDRRVPLPSRAGAGRGLLRCARVV